MKIIGIEAGTSYTINNNTRTFVINGLVTGLDLKDGVVRNVELQKSGVSYPVIFPGQNAWTATEIGTTGNYTIDYSTYTTAPVVATGDKLVIKYIDNTQTKTINDKIDLVQDTLDVGFETTLVTDTHPVYMGSTAGFFTAPFTGKVKSFAPALQCFINDIEVNIGANITAGDIVRLVIDSGDVGTAIDFVTQISSTLNFQVTAQRAATVNNESENLTSMQNVPFIGTTKALKGAIVDFEDKFFSGAIGGETISTVVNFQYFCEDSSYVYWVGNSFLFRKNKISGAVNKLAIGFSGNVYCVCSDSHIATAPCVGNAVHNFTYFDKLSFLKLFSIAGFSNKPNSSIVPILIGNRAFSIGASSYLHAYDLPSSTSIFNTSAEVPYFIISGDYIYANIILTPNIVKINTIGTPSIQATLSVFAGNVTVRYMEVYSGKVYCCSTSGVLRSFNLSDFTYDRQIATGLGILNFKIHNGYLYGVTATGTIYCIDLSTDLVIKTTINTFTTGGYICDIDRVNEMLAISNLGDLGYKIYKLDDLRIP